MIVTTMTESLATMTSKTVTLLTENLADTETAYSFYSVGELSDRVRNDSDVVVIDFDDNPLDSDLIDNDYTDSYLDDTNPS